MEFKVGDKVQKNNNTWIPNDFDDWGRGIGIGSIVDPPFVLDEGDIDVVWPAGRCFENINELIKV